MANIRQNFTRFLKMSIAAVLLVIMVIVVVNFITFSRRQPEVVRLEEDPPPQKVEKMERGKLFETKGGEDNLEVNFDVQFIDEEGLIHAAGNVWVRLREKYELNADEIIYDKDWTHFLLNGSGKVRYEDAVLEGSYLEYDTEEGVITTDRSATFTSARITGFAQDMVYDIEEEKLELKDQIYLQLTTKLDPSAPLVVEGERFEYFRKNRKGSMEGSVRFAQGESRGSAESVEFELFEGEENVRFVWLRGEVEGTLVEDLDGKTVRRVQADEVLLKAFLNFPKIHAMEAHGHCHFSFDLPSGNLQRGESDFLMFVLNREGRMREFHAVGKARLIDQDGESGEERVVEGTSLVIVEDREGLQIKGNDEFKASILTKDYEISAREIVLDTERNNFEADGLVKVILKPGKSEKVMGFFSQEKSVFITADGMRYTDEEKRFLFKGSIKSWQEKEILITDALTVEQETGRIFCDGQVKSIFPYTSKNTQEEEKVEIAAKKMEFDPEEKVIVFQEGCSLKARDVSMTCTSITIHLGEGESEMRDILAEGNVIISQQQIEGRGKEARFDVENETIVLLGNPVLVDKNRGKIEGDKLTFYIADDRIVVENQGQERSLSVIKS